MRAPALRARDIVSEADVNSYFILCWKCMHWVLWGGNRAFLRNLKLELNLKIK